MAIGPINYQELFKFRSKISAVQDRLGNILDSIEHESHPPSKVNVVKMFLSEGQSCRLNLDDGVLVLRNLTTASSIESPSMSMKDVQALADKKIKAFLSSHRQKPPSSGGNQGGNAGQSFGGSSSVPQSGNHANRNGRERSGSASDRPNDGTSKANRQNRCYDCDEPGHYHGDIPCKFPSVYTKKKKRLVHPPVLPNRTITTKIQVALFFGQAPAVSKVDELCCCARSPVRHIPQST